MTVDVPGPLGRRLERQLYFSPVEQSPGGCDSLARGSQGGRKGGATPLQGS
jgi:hypothetical protein